MERDEKDRHGNKGKDRLPKGLPEDPIFSPVTAPPLRIPETMFHRGSSFYVAFFHFYSFIFPAFLRFLRRVRVLEIVCFDENPGWRADDESRENTIAVRREKSESQKLSSLPSFWRYP
jgi:hypothetical protein